MTYDPAKFCVGPGEVAVLMAGLSDDEIREARARIRSGEPPTRVYADLQRRIDTANRQRQIR
jgi:hypothetical protein